MWGVPEKKNRLILTFFKHLMSILNCVYCSRMMSGSKSSQSNCSFQICCLMILDLIMTGANHPIGSNSLAMDDIRDLLQDIPAQTMA
jgi:hypothetical protein